MGNEYPTLVRAPRSGRKKLLLTRYDYISLAEESDFYIADFTSDETESSYFTEYQKQRSDSLDLRWFTTSDVKNDPKLSTQRSITLKFHDGLLSGTKLTLDKDKITIGRSPSCDIVLTPTSESKASNIA